MPFGVKTGRSAFYAEVGQEVVRLNEAPASFLNPVLIGKAARISAGDDLFTIADLYVTPGGDVVAVFPELAPGDLGALRLYAEALKGWTHEQLDEIATDFFYQTEGQGALLIDVMAGMGFLDFSGKGAFYAAVDNTLASGRCLLAFEPVPFYPVRCSRRKFIHDFSAIRGIDPDELTGFICELEAVDGVAAVILGSDLTISYSPPGDTLPVPLFYLKLTKHRADVCVSPRTLRFALSKNGIPLDTADELFTFFAKFGDIYRTQPSPEDGSIGLLVLQADKFLSSAPSLIEQIELFSRKISA